MGYASKVLVLSNKQAECRWGGGGEEGKGLVSNGGGGGGPERKDGK